MKLYEYQQKLSDSVCQYLWAQGGKSCFLQLGTGGGKSVTAGDIIKRHLNDGGKIMLLVHREEIIKQLHNTMVRLGIPAGIIAPWANKQPNLPVQVGSVQAYINRKDFDCTLLAFDEAHHGTADSYLKIIDRHPKAKLLGISATPYRLNRSGFASVFETMFCGPTTLDLENAGYLNPADVYINPLDPTKLTKVGLHKGDYKEDGLLEIMDNEQVTADVVDAYKTHAFGRRAIAFAINVAHSLHVSEQFNKVGIPSSHIESKGVYMWDTDKCEMVRWEHKEARSKVIKMVERGAVRVLSNVGIATEGTDIPCIDCVIAIRPTKSLSLHIQMTGRGSRLFNGKKDYILLDCANNVLEHGLPNEEHDWDTHFYGTKTHKGKKKEQEDTLVKVTTENGEQVVLSLKEVENHFPQGVKGIRMERISGIFRMPLFNQCMKEVVDSGRKKTDAYYQFCEILRSKNQVPNYTELLAIAKKLGHKQGWAWYENRAWELSAKKMANLATA